VLVTPCALALMLVVPTVSPLATPPLLMVAMFELVDDHVNVTPVMALPAWSRAVAENC
jgi:hypothetical protein